MPRTFSTASTHAIPPAPKGTEKLAMFEPLQRQPAYKALSTQMERRILSGELKPGTALPSEQELADQFGVNRSTVRESIRVLEQEGLLVRHGGRRLHVVLPGLFDLAPRAARALILHQVTFEELWQVAVMIEPEAARLAALKADAEDLAEIQHNVEATQATTNKPDQIEQHSELDVAFHALVARATKNRALMLAREPFSLLYRPALSLLQEKLPQSASRNVQAHEKILQALLNRDPDAAHHWMHKHLVDFRKGFLQAGLPMDTPLDHTPVPTA
jgi:GntR family transcriptional repressor for pyruvate dehydrogenase complex